MKKYIINIGLLLLLNLPCSGQWKVHNTWFHEPVRDLNILDMVAIQRDLLYLTATEYDDQSIMLFKSTDGGYCWNHVEVEVELNDCRFVSFRNPDLMANPWLISEDMISKDLGKTWSSFQWNFTPVFIDANTGFAFEAHTIFYIWRYCSSDIFRTDDGGKSWEKVFDENSDWCSCEEARLEIVNANTGWYLNELGVLLEMKNGEWVRRDSLILNGTDENLKMSEKIGWIDIHFYDEFNGWLSGYKDEDENPYSRGNFDQLTPILLKTNDGGISWDVIDLEKFTIEDMFFLDENTGWAIGAKDASTFIAFSDDGGVHWKVYQPKNPGLKGPLQFIANTGYILSHAGIYEIYQPLGRNNETIEQKLNVYPNPFTEKLNISLRNGKRIHRIELIDITGKTVMAIQNIEQDKYILERRNNLYPGLYFLKIYSDRIHTTQVAVIDP